jgi:hypothetical protein
MRKKIVERLFSPIVNTQKTDDKNYIKQWNRQRKRKNRKIPGNVLSSGVTAESSHALAAVMHDRQTCGH